MSDVAGNSGGEVTRLLHDWQQGQSGALDKLLPIIYGDLRLIAAAYLRQERPNHTLQATALINEAYLRLQKRYEIPFTSRSHFLAAVAKAMRNILVDHSRRQAAGKRIGAADKVTLTDLPGEDIDRDVDILSLDQALLRLSQVSERQAQVVELRFFAGLPEPEVAEVLGVSLPTVQRDWKVARIALRHWMTQDHHAPGTPA